MKKNARKWSILLILTLIFSFEGMAVFAAGDEAAQDDSQAAATEEAAEAVFDTDLELVQDDAKLAAEGYVNVTWKNYDGTVLKDEEVLKGTVPAFGDANPTRPADSNYTYSFTGWDPAPAEVTEDTIYTAQYKAEPIATSAPAVKGLVAYPGASQTSKTNGGTVTLYWSPDPNSVKYEIFVNGQSVGTATNANMKALPPSVGGKKVSFTASGLDVYKTHTFVVKATNATGQTAQATVKKQPVRTIRYVLTMKKKVTLKSHSGKSQSITLKGGEKVKAYGFGSGKYIFKRNDSIFYVAKSRGKKISAEYAKDFNYSRADAENYVNSAFIGSSSKSHLIWVSTYCQHVYYFKGTKGNWKCVRDWECATGKAISPSPTGMWGNKEIGKKIKSRHGLRFWSTYSSMNAFHGKQPKWKVGKPASGGCIRNANNNAEFIFKTAPKRTKVIVG